MKFFPGAKQRWQDNTPFKIGLTFAPVLSTFFGLRPPIAICHHLWANAREESETQKIVLNIHQGEEKTSHSKLDLLLTQQKSEKRKQTAEIFHPFFKLGNYRIWVDLLASVKKPTLLLVFCNFCKLENARNFADSPRLKSYFRSWKNPPLLTRHF